MLKKPKTEEHDRYHLCWKINSLNYASTPSLPLVCCTSRVSLLQEVSMILKALLTILDDEGSVEDERN